MGQTMSAHGNLDLIPDEPVFLHEGREIYLRCVNEDGDHVGDLRIATADAEMHASTLVNAANAGMTYYRSHNVEAGLRKLLDEADGPGGVA